MNVLLTGGTGYIGSHAAVCLLQAGHNIAIIDNLSNSQELVAGRIENITQKKAPLIVGDICDTNLLIQTIQEHRIDAIMHFAGLKAVGESNAIPISYYINNVQGTLSILNAMDQTGVSTMVFSSSATVYGEPQYLPIDEHHPTSATNPYGRSKLHIEEILSDVAKSDKKWSFICLRYFNPVGAHHSMQLGEQPNGVPNNLMPYIAQVAHGIRAQLSIFGNDYLTTDGTGVRDYIHVMDLAEGHLCALDYAHQHPGWHAINLGTGTGHSVLEMVTAFASASGMEIPYQFEPRRSGDVASCYAKTDKANKLLQWSAKRSLESMCTSTWAWQTGEFSQK
ncbi:UDP-glucose 4-epimerase GalE [Brachymonas chironomi]|uniref:UDP-glucose 4-epimerase GalE n=1 Tax=Brachymonas chironomi TaxID=491919 RepID=UPI00096DEA4D|nr:UDP-glucose 4-epimerase GalE [Brachymonas chironomi]